MPERAVITIPSRPVFPRLQHVGVYCRVSSRHDAQLESLGSQISSMCEYVIRHGGWTLAGLYVDVYTGAKSDKRDQLQRMLSDSQQNKLDVIVVRNVSRLSRNVVETLEITRKLKALGIEVIFRDDNISSMDQQGELVLTLIASIAQEDNQSRRLNIRWGRQRSAENGTSELYRKKCYGYTTETGILEIHKSEAEVVRIIFSSYLNGSSVHKICRQLESLGISSPGGKKHWCHHTIEKILINEKYYGAVCIGKTFRSDDVTAKLKVNNGERNLVWWFDHHEPIISKEMFTQIAAERSRRSNIELDENGAKRRKSVRYCSPKTDEPLPATESLCCVGQR